MTTFVEPAWGRQPGESVKVFVHFERYLHLPIPRSYVDLAKQQGKSVSYMTVLACKHKWKERASLWEDYIAQRKATRLIDVSTDTSDKQVLAIEKVLGLGMTRIDHMIENEEMPAIKDAIKMVFDSVKALKELREEASSVLELKKYHDEQTSKMDYDKLTKEELRTFIQLLNKGNGSVQNFPDEPKSVQN